MDIIFDSPEEEAVFASGDYDKWLALVEQEAQTDESNAPANAPATEQAASDHQPEDKESGKAGPVTPPTLDADRLRLIKQIKTELLHMEV